MGYVSVQATRRNYVDNPQDDGPILDYLSIVDAVRIPRIGPSLGGVESLIEQPLVMSYYECTPEERKQYGIPDNMIRLACGIENSQDLIDDIKQALEQ